MELLKWFSEYCYLKTCTTENLCYPSCKLPRKLLSWNRFHQNVLSEITELSSKPIQMATASREKAHKYKGGFILVNSNRSFTKGILKILLQDHIMHFYVHWMNILYYLMKYIWNRIIWRIIWRIDFKNICVAMKRATETTGNTRQLNIFFILNNVLFRQTKFMLKFNNRNAR